MLTRTPASAAMARLTARLMDCSGALTKKYTGPIPPRTDSPAKMAIDSLRLRGNNPAVVRTTGTQQAGARHTGDQTQEKHQSGGGGSGSMAAAVPISLHCRAINNNGNAANLPKRPSLPSSSTTAAMKP
jgi:hypothetical protein